MPKRSTAAQRAREVQRATGERYTSALRRQSGSPEQALHAAVRAAALPDELAMLDEVAAARREIAPMIDRADILSQLIYEGHDRLPAGERAALQREFDAIWAHIQALHGGDVYWEERQVLYAAHGALLRAGTIDDLHTRRLVSAAAGVLADGPGPLATADCIRCPNHFASAAGGCRHRPGSCRALADPPQDGARTPLSQAARHAAALLAMAARVPWGGDEQWTCCADLIDQALAAARCGLSAARST